LSDCKRNCFKFGDFLESSYFRFARHVHLEFQRCRKKGVEITGGAAPGIDLVDRLAKALGAATTDLIPVPAPPNRLAVLRHQAQTLFHNITQTEDHETLSLLNQFLAMLSEATAKKR
jgi:hypothetical protein